MTLAISEAQKELLLQAVERHAPELLSLVSNVGSTPLSSEERESLRDVALQEFLETGRQADDEPNERGHQLEAIIDALGHI